MSDWARKLLVAVAHNNASPAARALGMSGADIDATVRSFVNYDNGGYVPTFAFGGISWTYVRGEQHPNMLTELEQDAVCKGDTALRICLRRRRAPQVARVLVLQGARTDLANYDGETAEDLDRHFVEQTKAMQTDLDRVVAEMK